MFCVVRTQNEYIEKAFIKNIIDATNFHNLHIFNNSNETFPFREYK